MTDQNTCGPKWPITDGRKTNGPKDRWTNDHRTAFEWQARPNRCSVVRYRTRCSTCRVDCHLGGGQTSTNRDRIERDDWRIDERRRRPVLRSPWERSVDMPTKSAEARANNDRVRRYNVCRLDYSDYETVNCREACLPANECLVACSWSSRPRPFYR